MDIIVPAEFTYKLVDNKTIVNTVFPEKVFKIVDSDTKNHDFDERFFNVLDINNKERKIHIGDIINNMREIFPELCC